MKLKQGLWILVADGARASVFVNEGTAFEPRLQTVRTYAQDNPRPASKAVTGRLERSIAAVPTVARRLKRPTCTSARRIALCMASWPILLRMLRTTHSSTW